MAGEVAPPAPQSAPQSGRSPRFIYIVGGFIVVGGIGFWYFRKKKSASTTPANTTPTATSSDTGFGLQDVQQSQQAEIDNLYAYIENGNIAPQTPQQTTTGTGGPGGATGGTPPGSGNSGPELIGSGYLTQQTGYPHINPSQATWLQKNKKPIYYEPQVGTFRVVGTTKLKQGTPEYATQAESELPGYPKAG